MLYLTRIAPTIPDDLTDWDDKDWEQMLLRRSVAIRGDLVPEMSLLT